MLQLAPYQQQGVEWLCSRKRGGLLADEPGLGKTLQAIRACDRLGARRLLVACPANVRRQWGRVLLEEQELRRSVLIVEGGAISGAQLAEADVVVVSYEGLAASARRLAREIWLHAGEFDAAILDESHRLNNPKAWCTKVLLGKGCDGSGLLSRVRGPSFFLTGSPVIHHPGEWWPVMRALRETTLTYRGWLQRYCWTRQTRFGTQVMPTPRRETLPELRALISRIMLRRRFEEVELELPPVIFRETIIYGEKPPMELFVNYGQGPDAEAALEEALARELIAVEAILELGSGDEVLQALRGIAPNLPTLLKYVGLCKVAASVDFLTETTKEGAKTGRKVVAFAHHRDVLRGVQNGLRKNGVNAISYWGGMSPKKKEVHLERFARAKPPAVLLCNIQAAGIGLDGLQYHARHCVFIESSWSPEIDAQAVMRVHRRGQQKRVKVTYLALEGSYDEFLLARVMLKARSLVSMGVGTSLTKEMEKRNRGQQEREAAASE